MSILERLEQMERRMAEMTGSQQHKQGSGGTGSGGGGSGNGGSQAQVPVCDGHLWLCVTRCLLVSPFSGAGVIPVRGGSPRGRFPVPLLPRVKICVL